MIFIRPLLPTFITPMSRIGLCIRLSRILHSFQYLRDILSPWGLYVYAFACVTMVSVHLACVFFSCGRLFRRSIYLFISLADTFPLAWGVVVQHTQMLVINRILISTAGQFVQVGYDSWEKKYRKSHLIWNSLHFIYTLSRDNHKREMHIKKKTKEKKNIHLLTGPCNMRLQIK